MTRFAASIMLTLVYAFLTDGYAVAHDGIYIAHLAVTSIGVLFALTMAEQAFGCRAFQLADIPTFPRYMTNPGQYRLGSSIFMVAAASVFLVLVFLYNEVIVAAKIFNLPVPSGLLDALSTDKPSHLLIIIAIGMIYAFVIQQQHEWNPLLMMQNAIQNWISVPDLGRKIVAEISYALTVPEHALDAVIKNSTSVAKADFEKDKQTVDRIWAELCYMRWWISQRQASGEHATFFSEPSFGLGQLVAQYDKMAWLIHLRKTDGPLPPQTTTQSIYDEVTAIRLKFSRLVACYLLYRNGSRPGLALAARRFGIPFKNPHMDNPLQYSVYYVLTVFGAVYVSVPVSAILFDVATGTSVLEAIAGQDMGRVFSWIMYSSSNYGLAIVTVLALRFAMWRVEEVNRRSHMLTYCWTFLLAGAVGPLGLTIATKLNGVTSVEHLSYAAAYFKMLQWGMGPALVAVFITYAMDRQLCSDLPNVDTSMVLKRVLNGVLFTCFTVMLQVPQLMAIQPSANTSWYPDKLRFVAFGATFAVTLSLVLVSQFGLRQKRVPKAMAGAQQPAE